MSITSNFELQSICKHLKIQCNGVFSKNELPLIPKSGFYIVNMQNDKDELGNTLQGSHWVCCGFLQHQAFYFDSFGIIPPTEIIQFLRSPNALKTLNSKNILLYNSTQIQDLHQNCCGWYAVLCCFFIQFGKGYLTQRFKRFTDCFDDVDLQKNQSILQDAFALIYK